MRRSLATLSIVLLGLIGVPLLAGPAQALPDGQAVTPPMGWNQWNAFGCSVNEQLVLATADAMVANGMRDAGYRYVNIDDCWMSAQRDANGNLVADPAKFPHGMKSVADSVHAKGMKLGIYSSAGTATCQGFPASLGHEQADANLWASWGIDYLKYDNCNNQGVPAVQRYTAMANALKATGRNIVYSICNWGDEGPWKWGPGLGHLWRTTGDISDSWSSMVGIFRQNLGLDRHTGPGAVDDPDMLEVGNGGMTTAEYQSHVSLWAEFAAPLIAGTDLRNASATTLSLYTNADVIAVDQDPLVIAGHVVSTTGEGYAMTRPLAGGDASVLLFNAGDAAATISTTATAAGLAPAASYTLKNLWSKQTTTTNGAISATVPAHGVVHYRVGGGGTAVRAPNLTTASTTATFAQQDNHLRITAGGSDIWSTVDAYGAVYQRQAFADGTTTIARLGAQTRTDDWAKAGLMTRATITQAGSSPGYAIVAATPAHGYVLQWDSNGDGFLDSSTPDAGTTRYPSWVRLTRTGSSVTGYYSTDGFTWTSLGSASPPGMTTAQDIGVFNTAHSTTATGTADLALEPFSVGAITGTGSGRCIDIPNSVNTDGNRPILWDCHAAPNQIWKLGADGTITGLAKCLTASGTADNSPVILSACTGTTAQQWRYETTTHRLINTAAGKCLDAAGAATGNNTQLIIWPCHTGTNQQWQPPSWR
jgi:alpha-galactosidase